MNDVSLETRADRGDVEAQLELARRFEADANMAAARARFAQAAKGGSVAALRSLGINLLTQDPIQADSGVNMVRAAADKGDAEAAHLCAMLAAGDLDLPDRWNVARQCLEIAAERGWELAGRELEFLENSGTAFDSPVSQPHEVSRSPRISTIEGFATSSECDWLIARAKPHLHRAHVYDPVAGGGKLASHRTNSSVAFGIVQTDIVLMHLRARIEQLTGVHRLEGSSILHYAPGEEFKPHYDFLDSARTGYAADVAKNGQRVATFLIYLNEEFEGGETAFPKLDWRFRGKKGDALLFWNLTESGEPDPMTYHAGMPTTSGEKWLFSQWLRSAPPAR